MQLRPAVGHSAHNHRVTAPGLSPVGKRNAISSFHLHHRMVFLVGLVAIWIGNPVVAVDDKLVEMSAGLEFDFRAPHTVTIRSAHSKLRIKNETVAVVGPGI